LLRANATRTDVSPKIPKKPKVYLKGQLDWPVPEITCGEDAVLDCSRLSRLVRVFKRDCDKDEEKIAAGWFSVKLG